MAFTPRTAVYDDELPTPDPKVGAGETFINRAVNMIPLGRPVVDALSTAAMQGAKALGVGKSGVQLTPQAQAELGSMGVERQPEDTIGNTVDTYRTMRDTRAQRTAAGSKQNPWAGRAGALTGFGLSLLAPLPKGGAGLTGAMATGAGYGALAGLTDGKADLTRGEFGQALEDTVEGGAMGAAMGAAGHGLMRLGQKGVQALRNARSDTLAQETLAAQEEAVRAGAQAAKAGEAERKLVGGAREMNKKIDADRAKKLLQRARGGKGQGEAPPAEDPNTVVLEGMSGKAHQAQQSRTKDALQYRRQMGEPDVDTKISESWQDYIDRKPEALSNPPALRRQYMKEYLQSRYPNDPERVERIMSERVGPGGDILPRPAPATPAEGASTGGPSLATEAEEAMAARRAGAEGAQVGSGRPAPALPPPQDALPLQPPAERSMARPVDAPWIQGAARAQARPVLTQRPVRRGDSPAFDVGGKPPAGFEQARTRAGGGAAPQPDASMAAPVDAPLPPEALTRATQVPDLRRPVPLPPPSTPAAQPDMRLGPGAPAAPQTGADIQDVTRLAGPQDVGALAAERAAARAQNAMGAVAHAGYEGVRSGNSMLGAVFGGLAGLRREALRDPAVKARVLSAAKVQLLAQVSPEVFAKVGGQLSQAVGGGGGQYNAMRYVYARKDPQFREAEEKAAAQASRMTDDQLMSLIAGGAPQ